MPECYYMWHLGWIIALWSVSDRAAECLFCHWAPEGAGLQGARVVGDVHQQVKACGGCKGLIPPWTKLVGAALQVVSHLKLTAGAETGESSLIMGTFSKQIIIFARVVRKKSNSNCFDDESKWRHAFVWTHQRVLMTFEKEESRSSLEMKLYVMPKKASGFSPAFSFSWLTVYTSVMESTAETTAAPHGHMFMPADFFFKQAATCHFDTRS